MKMNSIKIFFVFLSIGLVFSSCYKEENWVDDNSQTENKYYPVIQKLVKTGGDTISAGELIKLTVNYWSNDPIKSLELTETANGADKSIQVWGYTDSFNEEAYAEVTTLDYTASTFSDTTDVTLSVTVLNENGLSRKKSVEVVVIP